MTRYPRKDPDARTGSNLRGQPLLAHRQATLARDTQQHQRLAKTQHQASRKLFTKADVRRAGEIRAKVNQEWREASVAARGDSLRIDALKVAARKKLERMLARDLPNYRQWKTLQRAQLREHQKLATSTQAAHRFDDIAVNWGDLVALDSTAQVFVPPYTSFDVHTTCTGDFIVFDESFAKPEIGHLVNNIIYDQDEHTSFSDGLWGLLPIENASNMVSCGVAFTTPSPGRLRVGAELQNFYNKVMDSVTDNFGFSFADIGFTLSLFIAVVRGTQVTFMNTDLLSNGIVSHGVDLSYAQSDLDNSVPYSISATTDQRFNANESVLVLAGSEVLIGTRLDDMHAKVNAVLWWKLNKLVIDMAPDIFT